MYTYVFCRRLGGTGDLLMLEPTLEGLYYKHKKENPEYRVRLVLITYKDYQYDLEDHPLIWQTVLDDNTYNVFPTERVLYHRSMETHTVRGTDITIAAGDFVYSYDFQGVIERSQLHGVDAFASFAQVTLKRRTPSFGNYSDQPAIPKRTGRVVQLRKHEHESRNLSREFFGVSPRSEIQFIGDVPIKPIEYMRTVKSAKCFVGPDSSGLHIAYAANVPIIYGIYTNDFPFDRRYYEGIRPIVRENVDEVKNFLEKDYAKNFQEDHYKIHNNMAYPMYYRYDEKNHCILKLRPSDDDFAELMERLNTALAEMYVGQIKVIYIKMTDMRPHALHPVELVKLLSQEGHYEIPRYTTRLDGCGCFEFHIRKIKKDSPKRTLLDKILNDDED